MISFLPINFTLLYFTCDSLELDTTGFIECGFIMYLSYCCKPFVFIVITDIFIIMQSFIIKPYTNSLCSYYILLMATFVFGCVIFATIFHPFCSPFLPDFYWLDGVWNTDDPFNFCIMKATDRTQTKQNQQTIYVFYNFDLLVFAQLFLISGKSVRPLM